MMLIPLRSRLRLGTRDRRALVLGAALTLPTLSWSLVARPYFRSLQAADAALAVQRDLLQREFDAVENAPRSPQELMQIQAALSERRPRLFAGDAIAATSALSNVVRDAASESGLALQQLDTKEQLQRSSTLRQLTVELRADGDFQGILEFLGALEVHDKLIYVSRLTIERSTAAQTSSKGPESLALSATLQGFAEPLVQHDKNPPTRSSR